MGIPRKENELIGKIADCQFAPGSSSFEQAKAAKKGDKIKIKGKYVLTFPVGPRLQDCEIVK
jgi:hypothetical protein